MKKTILIQIVLITSFAFAQDPNPDLFNQTWYLYAVDDSEGDYIDLENWYPDYAPYVIIDETLDFNGLGLCNTFTGTLEKHPDQNYFRTIVTDVTTNVCNDPFDYEPIFIGPFGFVDPDPDFYTIINPQLTYDPDGYQTMIYGTQPFVGYIYRNTPILSIDDFKENVISMYPNPTRGVLKFYMKENSIKAVTIYSLLGDRVFQSPIDASNLVDISSLRNGMYFIEIEHSEGREIQRILKF